MSKRKADGTPAPVSAFAAARAKRAQIAEADAFNAASEPHNVNDAASVSDALSVTSTESLYHDGLDIRLSKAEGVSSVPYSSVALRDESLSDFDHGTMALRLRRGEYVTCVGIYDLRVTEGAMRIHGAHLAASTRSTARIYAPYGSGLHQIVCLDDAAAIEIRSVDCGVAELERISPFWRKVWHISNDTTFALLDAQSTNLPFQTRAIPADNNMAAIYKLCAFKDHASNARILVTGAKGSGKSTFAKAFTNAALTIPNGAKEVFWLDVDPGQPEFGIPGQISLTQVRDIVLGPSYTHAYTGASTSYRTLHSHVIGAPSPREDIEHYISCVRDLVRRANTAMRKSPGCPLVINCPGWITGSGEEIMHQLIETIRPTNVAFLDMAAAVDHELIDWLLERPGIELDRVTQDGTERFSRPAAEIRAMQTMLYFHTQQGTDDTAGWSTAPIVRHLPLSLPFGRTDAPIARIYAYHAPLPLTKLSTVLEGSVVFLVACDATSLDSDSECATTLSPEGLPYLHPRHSPSTVLPPLDPRHTRCIGPAIVKNIDTESQEINLLTPLPAADILSFPTATERLLLIRGKVDSPDWYFTEPAYWSDWLDRAEAEGRGEMLVDLLGEEFDVDEKEEEEEGDEGDDAARRPYVAPVTIEDGGGYADDPGAALGGRVWRARHLPRYR